MILGQLRNLADERNSLSLAVQKGFDFLLSQDVDRLSSGRYEIDGASYANVDEYKTQPKKERRPEAHCKYIDIQYMAAGREIIGHSFLSESSEVTEQWPDRDLFFYKDSPEETELKLAADDYAVFFPWDIHRPCCVWDDSVEVKKIVVKIKI